MRLKDNRGLAQHMIHRHGSKKPVQLATTMATMTGEPSVDASADATNHLQIALERLRGRREEVRQILSQHDDLAAEAAILDQRIDRLEQVINPEAAPKTMSAG